jgi:ADP-ribosyl-[dinitrogen reductase] hydrolase
MEPVDGGASGRDAAAEAAPIGRTRALGAMLGQLAGDALGSMVEFQSAARIRELYPDGLRTIQGSPLFHTLAGQPTDDSELALALADALIAAGSAGYDPGQAARAYMAWARSGPFDIGGTIGRAIRVMEEAEARGHDPVAAAYGKPYGPRQQANGALMRQVSLGIWGAALDADRVAAAAMADARLTHGHPVCLEASAVFSVSLARTIRDGGSGAEALATARAWHRAHGREGAVRDALERSAHEPPARYTGYVLHALQNAFYQAVHTDSVEAGIVATVMAGDDTDTNACIAGALLGAIHGEAGVPEAWRRTVLTCEPGPDSPRPRPARYWPSRAVAVVDALWRTGWQVARAPDPWPGQ